MLDEFPEKSKADILLRIATLNNVQPAAMRELNNTLEKQLTSGANVQSSQIGGIKTAANILNFMDSTGDTDIIEIVSELDEDMGQQIQDLMFVFDNLAEVDDRGIQALLREVSSDVLIVALKGADTDLKDKIFKNMSKRAAELPQR